MADDPPPLPPLLDLTAATAEEVAEALSYALRFDERGKPRKGGWDFAAGLAAERLTEHLRRSGFVMMRCHRRDETDPGVECAPGGGQGQAAVLTVCWVC